MRIIPVIDLMGGVVVRGVAGQRESYLPVTSALDCDAIPERVAVALRTHTNCDAIYVADLDAIAGAAPDWTSYDAVAACGAVLWIDAGVRDVGDVRTLQSWGGDRIGGVVVALETLPSTQHLPELASAIGTASAIFSLDLKHGSPLTNVPSMAKLSAVAIAKQAHQAGFRRLIVLDLAGVGVGKGVVTEKLCAQLRESFPGIELISGGGIRDQADLDRLASAGCDAALVATALHEKRL